MSDDCSDQKQLPLSCTSLVELLQKRALHQPEQKYTFLPEGESVEVSLTYQELDRRSRAIAAHLQALNLSGERALLLYPPGVEYLTAFFGCLYANVIAVPLYPPKLKRNLSRIEAIAADSGATVAIATASQLNNLEPLWERSAKLKTLYWLASDRVSDRLAEKWQQPQIDTQIDNNQLAYLQYTSGSTSTPKGVKISHQNVLHNIQYIDRGFEHTSKSVALTWLPHFHDMGLIDGLLKPLYLGIPCYFMPPAAFIQKPLRWLETISRYQVTHSGGPNFAYDLCSQKISPEPGKTLDLSSWRVAYNGAEPIQKETLEKFAQKFECWGFKSQAFCPAYGMAETTLKISTVSQREHFKLCTVEAAALEKNQIVEVQAGRTLVGCGYPEFGTKVAIVDPDSFKQCILNEVGEIWVAGHSVALGYWQRLEETKASFLAEISDTGEGPFFRTGDLGFLREGELFITGRLKDLIIIRGRNLYPQDIERTVEQSHPSLRKGAGAAFTVEIDGAEQLVVLQELEARKAPNNAEEIIAVIRQNIAEEYEVEVYAVLIIKPGSIPKTSSGKIQRRAARADFLTNSLEVLASSILEVSNAPESKACITRQALLEMGDSDRQSVLESYLQELLARLLKVVPSFVNSQVLISTVGLDSLKVFEFKNQLESDLNICLGIGEFFEDISIAELGTKIIAQLAIPQTFIPIKSIAKNENISLSFAQERLWFFDQLEPENPFYNLAGTVRLTGKLNTLALTQSLDEVIKRHEILRTAFTTLAGQPIQVINPDYSFNFPIIDLSDRPFSERDIEVQKIVAKAARSPFELAGGCLLRPQLLRLGETEHILLLTAHHIIFDGYSVGIFLEELIRFYQAFSTENLPSLPPLLVQYADYAIWQRQSLQSNILLPELTYWQQQLKGNLPVLNLPTDFPRPAIQTFQGARIVREFPQPLNEVLSEVSQQEKSTLFMTLLAAFKTLLYRYTGQEDILVGTPISNRNCLELEGLIGFFVNTLVLRTDLSDNPSFLDLLSRVREVALGAYSHQNLPFEKLVEELHPERDLSYSPLFQVAFVFQNNLTQTWELPELNLTFQEVDTGTAKFDLTLYLEVTKQGLMATWEYNTALFQASTIARMNEHFHSLLEAIVVNPSQKISDLPLLTERERHQLLVTWNNTQIDYPQEQLIHQLFELQTERSPDAIAVIDETQKLTYQELNQRANQLAGYLQELAVGPEVLVGICIERSIEMLVGVLAVLKAGGAYVPLDPAYPKERLAFMLADAQVAVLLTQKKLLEILPENRAKIVCIDGDWSGSIVTNYSAINNPSNLAYVIYTSGSTGKPKGVAIAHRSTVALLNWAQGVFTKAEIAGVLASTSLCFDLSVFELFVPLSGGGTVILAENALDLPNLPAADKVTLINTVPSAIAELFRINAIPSSVRTVNLAGEALPNYLVQQLYQLPNIQKVFNLYGPSEDTTYSTYSLVEKGTHNPVNIGRPLANTQVYILDAHQQLVPIGVPGELHIGGAGLARGYLNRSELTAEKFIPNPFKNTSKTEPKLANLLYKTGDLARYLPDGNIGFLGRIDNQVKIRGFRIELGEIETVLCQHPAVWQAVAIAREEEFSNKRLIAYVVPQKPEDLFTSQSLILSNELRSYLKHKLPESMMPAAFVFLEALPLTPNGKVDRRALPAPDAIRPELEATFVAPRNHEEQRLAEIWSQVLGIKQVGIRDNFFELGGHSLLATQLIAKVREAMEVELPLRCLFQSPTVESLAIAIFQQKGNPAKEAALTTLPIITPDLEGRYQAFPLTDIQQAYWIGRGQTFELGNISTHIYAEIESVNLDLHRFQQAWQKLINRHDMLRGIVRSDGQQQIIEQVADFEIPILDLRGQSSEAVNSQLEAVRAALSHQILDSNRWPLFEIRASLLDVLDSTEFKSGGDGDRVRLHFSFDALIGDAWSFQIIGNELAKLYQSPQEPLPKLELSFRDYVLAELANRNSEQYQRSLDYWQNRLPTLPPAPELSLALNPAMVDKPRFARRRGFLAPQLWQHLKNRATKVGMTPSGILLAAFAEVLAIWSKNPRFTIGLTLFNRLPLHPQVNDIVGDFTSLILLAIERSTSDTFAIRGRRIQEQLWEDLDHRYVSGVQVLRDLSRIQGRVSAALMPVVFTSTLTQDAFGEQNFPMHWLGETIYSITQTPQVFLDNQVSEEGGSLVFCWDAIEEIFPLGMLDDMFTAYGNLLERLADSDEIWQQEYPQLLSSTQLKQRAAINATSAPVSVEMLHTLFVAQVEARSQQSAVIASDRTLNYQELYHLSHQLGWRLRTMGARPNTLVAIVMEKGWEQVVACLGILMAGAAYVPIDPKLPQERRSHLFAQAEIQFALTQPCINADLDWPESIQRIEVDNSVSECDRTLDWVQTPEDLAYAIYTSGSTGLPKGVAIDHRGAVNTIIDINQRFGVNANDRVLALSSLSFDLSVYDIFGTLAAGGTIVIPEAYSAQDPAHWAELMVREKITIWNSVPALMQMMVNYATSKPEVFANLRLVLLSGDWLPLTLSPQIKSLVPQVQVISLGGATEASIWSILYPIEEVNPNWKTIPYGQPMKNQNFYVFNDVLESCPVWVPGQLYIGGIGLAKGYWRDEVKTAASFITHPQTGERLYRTGDLGRYLPDGNIEFLGREDFQVKINGYRIELGEIEAALTQHPAIREAVIIVGGEQMGNQRLVAYVAGDASSISTEKLRQFLKQKLPEYMVPLSFIMLDTLPLTSNGKVDRHALPIPNFDKSELDATFVAPRNPIEQVLAEIWAEILRLPHISIHDNFFEVGGHSLLATQLLTKVRETFQVEFPLSELFEVQTIAEFSQKISEAKSKKAELQEPEIAAVSRNAYRRKLASLNQK
ncbi:amino acid adenylation domain-containing protein [Kamptonema animale CS-326]|jgi:amino acid adenylation domain-containing protein|uniref:non-ribosomal peptide synthetase n=1 Tax=Kamptonema animale TaxID=92934 RepID=UPI00232AED48|nr:non-ribosomal peptide synthetase [Kamptonema animale]MDB9510453.1 amino acid adenylation domain-containing protein [Kamptonema animale CS-326]